MALEYNWKSKIHCSVVYNWAKSCYLIVVSLQIRLLWLCGTVFCQIAQPNMRMLLLEMSDLACQCCKDIGVDMISNILFLRHMGHVFLVTVPRIGLLLNAGLVFISRILWPIKWIIDPSLCWLLESFELNVQGNFTCFPRIHRTSDIISFSYSQCFSVPIFSLP